MGRIMKRSEYLLKQLNKIDEQKDVINFCLEVEEYVFQNFDEIEKENATLSTYLNDEFLDFCDEIEPDTDKDYIRERIKQVIEKICNILNQ